MASFIYYTDIWVVTGPLKGYYMTGIPEIDKLAKLNQDLDQMMQIKLGHKVAITMKPTNVLGTEYSIEVDPGGMFKITIAGRDFRVDKLEADPNTKGFTFDEVFGDDGKDIIRKMAYLYQKISADHTAKKLTDPDTLKTAFGGLGASPSVLLQKLSDEINIKIASGAETPTNKQDAGGAIVTPLEISLEVKDMLGDASDKIFIYPKLLNARESHDVYTSNGKVEKSGLSYEVTLPGKKLGPVSSGMDGVVASIQATYEVQAKSVGDLGTVPVVYPAGGISLPLKLDKSLKLFYAVDLDIHDGGAARLLDALGIDFPTIEYRMAEIVKSSPGFMDSYMAAGGVPNPVQPEPVEHMADSSDDIKDDKEKEGEITKLKKDLESAVSKYTGKDVEVSLSVKYAGSVSHPATFTVSADAGELGPENLFKGDISQKNDLLRIEHETHGRFHHIFSQSDEKLLVSMMKILDPQATVAKLDRLASELEGLGHIKLAYELDQVSDLLAPKVAFDTPEKPLVVKIHPGSTVKADTLVLQNQLKGDIKEAISLIDRGSNSVSADALGKETDATAEFKDVLKAALAKASIKPVGSTFQSADLNGWKAGDFYDLSPIYDLVMRGTYKVRGGSHNHLNDGFELLDTIASTYEKA